MSKCPTCEKPTVAEFRPFCSERCKLVDLNRWFTGAYTSPAVETDDVDIEALEAAMQNPDETQH